MNTLLKTNINGIIFKNPVIAASGTFGFGQEYNRLYEVEQLGGICSKGLTLNSRQGNAGIRIFETSSGIMNSVGLQNPGIETFIREELPKMKALNTNIIANLGGSTPEDYIAGARMLSHSEVDIIELNISCPNVKSGGMAFGIKSNVAMEIVKDVKSVCLKPLMVKLSPNAENIVDMALACVEGGANSLSLVNTFKAMAIDIYRRKPVFNNTYAGLSGAAIKPVALRMVHEVCRQVHVPVVGIGGIYTAEDAISFIMAGATAIQVGTANFSHPYACLKIIEGIRAFMEKENIKTLEDIRGIV